jgi:hypothetical protein
MRVSLLPACVVPCLVALSAASAGGQMIEVRRIDTPSAVASGAFGYLDRVRELPDGRVLVNDPLHRRLMTFSANLDTFSILADSSSTPRYGPSSAALVPTRADSTWLIDGASLSMLVIDPHGAVVRIAAAPEMRALVALGSQSVGFDGLGRLVFRDSYDRGRSRQASSAGVPFVVPDSAPLVAYDVMTRRRDTLAALRQARTLHVSVPNENRLRVFSVAEPFPMVDEAVVLSDGRTAIVRGRDYRIDWIVGGQLKRGPRIDFPWQRITDDDKVRLLDSLARMGRSPGMPPHRAIDSTVKSPLEGLSFEDLPDYRPAFVSGGVRADADGNLWVRTTITLIDTPGPVWDVIDGNGALKRRILLPVGRGIVGFGRNGTVFMASRDGETTRLEKARARIE